MTERKRAPRELHCGTNAEIREDGDPGLGIKPRRCGAARTLGHEATGRPGSSTSPYHHRDLLALQDAAQDATSAEQD